MPRRLPACEPCRFSKRACDHSQPCVPCRDRSQEASCTYRKRGFSVFDAGAAGLDSAKCPLREQQHSFEPLRRGNFLAETSAASSRYPNPGYLGSSSHVTIFNRLPPVNQDEVAGSRATEHDIRHRRTKSWYDESLVAHGANLIENLRCSLEVSACRTLVEAWIAKGVNLALAGCFTKQCAQTSECVLNRLCGEANQATKISTDLYRCSCNPLQTEPTSTFEDFCENFCYPNVRWETLALFCTAVSRAATDVTSFAPLYETQYQRRKIQRNAMHYADQCLEISISLDCLNDLQLLLQYENFINHSIVDGDQSYHSWRKLGDVASSLFALGYHESVTNTPPTPAFLRDLRRGAFARTYSADKNVSIFLGRPPRINRKYCLFRLPGYETDNSEEHETSASVHGFRWSGDEKFDYMTDTKWSALCALLKEDILDLVKLRGHNERLEKASSIEADAAAHWNALPPYFRLEGPLRICDRKATDRDLMVSMRLNHLHVLLLIRLALLRRITEPDQQLLEISAEMLGLTVEAAVCKEYLANSGTGLVWKVAYYGLPAAGIVCLFLLNGSTGAENAKVAISKVIQDLSVLVAEIETGALVHFEDPNYALLAEAARTIKSILDVMLTGNAASQLSSCLGPDVVSPILTTRDEQDLPLFSNRDFHEFELDFWLNLAEHPALFGTGNETHSTAT